MITFVPQNQDEWRILLSLADNPRHDVKTTSGTRGLGAVVPDELYERFLRYQSLSESPAPKATGKKEKQS